jgi:hypothetical protein
MEPAPHLTEVDQLDTRTQFENLLVEDIVAFNRPTGANKIIIQSD